MRVIPNLFVIGAPKAGTTGFVAALKEHPEIFVPNKKEPRFFDAHLYYDHEKDWPIRTLEEYLELYSSLESRSSAYRLDGSVFNMYSRKSIADILRLSPNAKFVIILRDPLSSVKSMFSQRMKYTAPFLREVSEDFDRCWQLMKDRKNGVNFPPGCRNKILFRYDFLYAYEKSLPAIIDLINKDNLYIGSYKQYKNKPNEFYAEIVQFLGLNMEITNKIENKSYHVKPSRVIKLLGRLPSKTKNIRLFLGLYGRHIDFIVNKFFIERVDNIKVSSKSDADIKNFFARTYDYLNEIGVDV